MATESLSVSASLPMTMPMVPPPGARAFVDAAGWSDGEILPLAGDASFRRYFRVVAPGRQAVLMDAPPDKEDSRPFLTMARYLNAHGFRAPRILAEDLEQGLILIEDFGDRLIRSVLEEAPEQELAIYGRAVDLITDLATRPPADVGIYELPDYLREVRLFTEWTVPALGITVDVEQYDAAWTRILAPFDGGAGGVTVLRDYHAENIMLLDDGDLGLLDFQDALIGHPAYDLVSLLQDARRDVSPAIEAAMLDRYCAATGAGDEFRAAYAILGAQRNVKIIGIFTRLAWRDGKERYLDMIPRMWGLLERDLAHPVLAEIAAWFDQHVPAAMRVAPPAPAAA